MNSLYASPVCRLTLSVSRVGVRQGQMRIRCIQSAAAPKPETAEEKDERTRVQKEEKRINGHPEGHGEQIWIHNHIYDGHVMYSFHRAVDSNKGHRQLPYTGKKLVPAKMRRDYWRPLALVEFGPGLGTVGRSAYHKLREFKKRHELEWTDDAREADAMLRMNKRERGKKINDQRANAVADLAAVLGGVGKGSKMWMVGWEDLADKEVLVRKKHVKTGTRLVETGAERLRLERMGVRVEEGKSGRFVDWQSLVDLVVEVKEGDETKGLELEKLKKLHGATVYWANEQDRFFAKEWTDNVEHVLGLPASGVNKEVEETGGPTPVAA